MTATVIRDMNSALNSLVSAPGRNVKSASGEEFQKVWDQQSGKTGSEVGGEDKGSVAGKAKSEDLKIREEQTVRRDRIRPEESTKEVAGTDGELTEEQLEEAMEMLGTAATELIQTLADTLGVSVEEVQAVMDELGMKEPDLLQPGQLGELLLKMSGQEDSYALVTNEELYNSYRELMGKLEEAVDNVGQELNLTKEQMSNLVEQLQDMQEQPVQQAQEPADMPDIQVEDLRAAEENEAEQPLIPTTESAQAQEAGEQTTADTSAGESKGDHQMADKGEAQNLILQNLKAEQFNPEVSQTTQTTMSAWDADTQNIMRQIMDYMRIQVKPDMSNLEMQLHPESLGTVQIHVASKGGMVTAQFIAENEAVKSVLESQMIRLQESFEEQGIKVNSIEVNVQAHEFEQNLEQGRGNNRNQEPDRRNRTRRINLNAAILPEEMEEDEALAAEMMAADGNTVDYTV